MKNKKISISKFDIVLTVLLILGLVYYLYIKGYIFVNFENVSPKEAYKMLQEQKDKIVLIDVRTPQEYKEDGHIKGAILIPVDQLHEKVDELRKYKNDKILMVYCRSGNRSVLASRFLSGLGFKVYNIKGGINKWKEEGLPVEK
jgi:rhodanese-related sulfurtransferase